jgi:hypothetical protein
LGSSHSSNNEANGKAGSETNDGTKNKGGGSSDGKKLNRSDSKASSSSKHNHR